MDLLHLPTREDFADTMTAEEKAVWSVHFERFEQALADGMGELRPFRVSLLRGGAS